MMERNDPLAQSTVNAEDLAAKAHKLCADFTEVLRQSTIERPFATLAIAAGVGFVLAALRTVNRAGGESSRERKSKDRNC